MPRLKVFLTGATGRVGRVLVPAFREHYELRTLHRRPAPEDPTAVLGDLSDRIADGHLEPSSAPGLGVEFDEKEAAKHPYGEDKMIRLFETGWEMRER